MNLNSLLDSKILQTCPRRRMTDLSVVNDVFDFRIRNAAVVLEKRWQPPAGDVAALIDGGGQHGPAELTVPNGIIGSATKERNSERRTSNDHAIQCSFLGETCRSNP